MEEVACPKCGEECWRDEVDVGVGVICGPWGCGYCGWSESEAYDRSNGPSPAQLESPDRYVDPFGGSMPLSAIEEKLDWFGLPGRKIVDEVFRGNDGLPEGSTDGHGAPE